MTVEDFFELCDFLSSRDDEYYAEIEAIANTPNLDEPRRTEGRDPFGMNWRWLYGQEAQQADKAGTAIIDRANRSPERRRLIGWAMVLAASLLIGVLIGRTTSTSAEQQVLIARVATRYGTYRGDEDVLQARVESALPGFVTIVSLASDRRPLAAPVEGADLVRVGADDGSSWVDIPDNSERLIVLVTETPATEVIRRSLRETRIREFGPADADKLEDDLVELLQEMGYRRVAVASAEAVSGSDR